MRRITLAFVPLGFLLLGSVMVEASPRLGAAAFKADRSVCVTLQGDRLRIGDRMLFFLFSPPRVVEGRIREESRSPCNLSVELEGHSYKVSPRYPITVAEEIGIAIFDPTARVEYADGEFVVHTAGARTPLQVRLCASQEGLHLTAWRGNRRTWHEYWYLGFDLEPNCSDEETKE
jgi:hypothetical protein